MNKYLLTILSIFVINFNLFSQNQNVAINNTGALPDASAMLDVSSSAKGLLIPRMTTVERNSISNPATGLVVYDKTLNEFYYHNGTAWTGFSGGAGGGTLDDAYDFGGSGAGRIITIDNGQVEFQTGVNNVKIGYTGTSSAIMDIVSTEKGILIPRMSSAQRNVISSPAAGLLVYDSDLNQFWYFNGTQWAALVGGGSGATITAFDWNDTTNDLTITEDGTPWTVNIDNEADDLSDNVINDLSDVDATPTGTGQVLKWDGSKWYAGTDEAGAGGTQITAFQWTDATDLLRITEGGIDWDVTIDNEADDLSDNVINDLSDVDATPSVDDFLKWNGTEWVAGTASAASCLTLEEAYNCGGAGAGRTITANSGAVEVNITSASGGNKGLQASAGVPNSFAISAEHSSIGVAFGAGSTNASNTYSTLQATTNSTSNSVSAILGNTTGGAWGVTGQVEATGTASAGVHGNNLRTTGGHGVYGMGVNGLVGETNRADGYGVYGINNASQGTGDGPGVYGIGSVGVYGQTNNGASFGIYGENLSSGTTDNNVGAAGWGWVGVFGQTSGGGFGVYSDGELGSSGTKSFVIDHPLDPANKTLKHYCAESPEVLNIYRGNIILDENGEAKVVLPDYFSKINTNFSYYLTPIGAAAPNLHVKQEVEGNAFVVSGGKANLKVSWVIYAERNDKYIKKYPKSKQVEIEKRQKGKYWRPELYNKSSDFKMINLSNHKRKEIKGKLNKSLKQPKQNILK